MRRWGPGSAHAGCRASQGRQTGSAARPGRNPHRQGRLAPPWSGATGDRPLLRGILDELHRLGAGIVDIRRDSQDLARGRGAGGGPATTTQRGKGATSTYRRAIVGIYARWRRGYRSIAQRRREVRPHIDAEPYPRRRVSACRLRNNRARRSQAGRRGHGTWPARCRGNGRAVRQFRLQPRGART